MTFDHRRMRVFAKERPGIIECNKAVKTTGSIRPAALDRWNPAIHAADEPSNVIQMYDVIGEDFWSGGGITAKSVSADLKRIGAGDVEVHINSPGGDMFEGIAIYNLLASHPGTVTIKVMGLAASAASIIAMSANDLQIGEASFLMIHNCWVMAVGNRHDMFETASYLEPFDKAMAAVYAKRSGQDIGKIEGWMDANGGDGTYFSTQQAIDLGFADNKIAADAVKLIPSAAQKDGKPKNELLKAELALCSQMSKPEARALLAKINGTAAADPTTKPVAGDDLSWLFSGANNLLSAMKV